MPFGNLLHRYGQLKVGIFQFAILLLEGKSIKPWIFNYFHRLDGWDLEPRQNYGYLKLHIQVELELQPQAEIELQIVQT